VSLCLAICYRTLLLCFVVRCHSLLLCLVAHHALLFTVALVIHLRALMFVAMPNYLPLRLVVYLFFFKVPLAIPPPIVVLLPCCSLSFLVVVFFYINWYLSPLSCASGGVWNNINKFHST
jgi:hypothetical protein